MQVSIYLAAVGNFSTVCKPDGPGWDVEHINCLTTLVGAFLSAVVGGEESGCDIIWPTVNLEGENVGRMCLQPESSVFKLLRATISEQVLF